MATVLPQLLDFLLIMVRLVIPHTTRAIKEIQALFSVMAHALRQLLDFLGIMAGVVLPHQTHVAR